MEYTISGQELERLRKTCKLRLTISVILAVAVYLAVLGFTVWVFFLGDPEMGARLDAPLSEKLVTAVGGPLVIAVLALSSSRSMTASTTYSKTSMSYRRSRKSGCFRI